ncbi:MAG: hypothetical protein JSS49_29995 [Planctomycetes bacterium]|nr:hypothetical protein [Planctomycetota bacterium]
MYASKRPAVLGLCALVIVGAVAVLSKPHGSATVSAETLKATGPLKWFRGNLHTHSHWSDGDDYLESIALWYRERQYDFLCFTDHNTLAERERWVEVEKTKGGIQAYEKLKAKFPDGWNEERMTDDGKLEVRLKRFEEVVEKVGEPGKFLLIQGEEISDKFGPFPIHLNVHNVRETVFPRGGRSVTEVIQQNVDAVIAQRERTGQPMLVHLNHPNFGWGVTAEDLMRVRGENFFEVYNGHPGVFNAGDAEHASTERIWDIINSIRLTDLGLPLMYGLATDDGHNYHKIPSRASEPGRGWVMVLAGELTPGSLIEALEAGRFYASSGVTLEEVTRSDKSISVTVKPDPDATYRIDFIGTRKGFDHNSEPVRDKVGKKRHATRRYSSEIGAILKSVNDSTATYEFTGEELFVRARVTSSRKHPNPSAVGEFECAWTQPTVP